MIRTTDPVLRAYGSALALTNVVAAVFWVSDQPIHRYLEATDPVCWPFFEGCYRWRVLSHDQLTLVIGSVAALSVMSALLFAREEHTRAAFGLLIATSLTKFALVLQDYRLIMNQHYMAAWVLLFYALSPAKRLTLKTLIVCFYFWAGLLKLNGDWITGAALYGRHPLGLPSAFIPGACVYVIILELVIVFGLLARRTWIFWCSLTQLLLFHVASFWVVGFFYPVLMFLILSIFAMDRIWPAPVVPADGREFVGRAVPARVAVGGAIVIFSAFQLVPHVFPGDPAVSGEGRLFALNMFDAPTTCVATVSDYADGGRRSPTRFRVPFVQPRIACDPVVYMEAAKTRCRLNRINKTFDDFDLDLWTRRSGMTAAQRVVSVAGFCSAQPSYSLLRHNAWIGSDHEDR